MAPLPLDTVEGELRQVIQDLYQLAVTLNSFQGEQSSAALTTYIKDLFTHLGPLQNPSLPVQEPSGSASTSSADATTTIPPEIIAYVDSGRNPDIYTREFVELVQKSNQFLKGRSEALAEFRDVLAQTISTGLPELKDDAKMVVEQTGGTKKDLLPQ